MILTSYVYVGVHCKKNNGVSSTLAPVSTVTLWIRVVMTNCCHLLVLQTCVLTVVSWHGI
jgi:hypothetical protein